MLALLGMLVSCEKKDCLCKYYDQDNSLVARESFDGEEVDASACSRKQNDKKVEVHDTTFYATSVSCSTSW